ncbi:MAG: hypothetical protein LQ350_008238 [Teloschistes chrysophthalmus]|nr:MAG: hypothetical protein LQ350_008238 [Niorma chrysophthalma]
MNQYGSIDLDTLVVTLQNMLPIHLKPSLNLHKSVTTRWVTYSFESAALPGRILTWEDALFGNLICHDQDGARVAKFKRHGLLSALRKTGTLVIEPFPIGQSQHATVEIVMTWITLIEKRFKIGVDMSCSPGGIGHSLALEFHSRSLRVLATARRAATISHLAERGIETLSLDVDKPEEVERCRDEVSVLTAGKLDYLVNNAGRNYTVPALDVSLAEIQATFDTNVFAVMNICATFSPLLIRSRGTIVQIGSVAGMIPYVFGSVYNASKAALHSYSDTLRVELAPFGVSVIIVATGGVRSNIARTERVLPVDSLYAELETTYQRRQKYSQEVGMDTASYAKEVVGQILKGDGWVWKRRMIWAGSSAGLVGYLEMVLGVGSGFWDWLMTRMFQLGKLYRKDIKSKRL